MRVTEFALAVLAAGKQTCHYGQHGVTKSTESYKRGQTDAWAWLMRLVANQASVNNISSSMSTLPTASETLRDAVLPRGRTLVKGHTLSTVGPRMLLWLQLLKHAMPDETRKSILRGIDQKMRQVELAKLFNVSRATISVFLKKMQADAVYGATPSPGRCRMTHELST
ncbi:hypothetical protein RB195_014141 [Necator americanus]|uniref:HTH psq-type domain-containing protein n=1 Tax=Necator americanus TaxID=51031 RepID=A0ABR1DYU4_NECAM